VASTDAERRFAELDPDEPDRTEPVGLVPEVVEQDPTGADDDVDAPTAKRRD
jgi:hypothetical protein